MYEAVICHEKMSLTIRYTALETTQKKRTMGIKSEGEVAIAGVETRECIRSRRVARDDGSYNRLSGMEHETRFIHETRNMDVLLF